NDGSIEIWDMKDAPCLERCISKTPGNSVEGLAWSGDRLLVLANPSQYLKADVLAVAVDEEESKLFCAGIEPTIRIYSKTLIKREDMVFHRWVKFLQRRVHDHDVKALVCAQDSIYSGGVDGYLGLSSASKTQSKIVKYGPFLQPPCVTVAAQERLILLRYTNYLEIWRLGSSTGCQELIEGNNESLDENVPQLNKKESKTLSLDTIPEKLLEFRSKNDETIVCSSLSPNGRWLCYSTQKEIRLFQFVPGTSTGDKKQPSQLVRVKDLPEQFAAASHIYFTADSMRLIMVNRETKQILYILHTAPYRFKL
ncbi:hypothetical protein DOY81_011242, partial [Sarcophaga bullata]